MRIVYVSYSHPAVAPGGDQEVACELCDNALRGHLNARACCVDDASGEATSQPGGDAAVRPV